jgi:LysM repeat protein
MSTLVRILIIAGLVLALFAGVSVQAVHADDTGTYVVQPGDSLSEIAQRHGLALGDLADMNGLGTEAWLYVGQRIVLPGYAAASAAVGTAQYATDPRVPDPMPALPVVPGENAGPAVPFIYAQVVEENVPVYGRPGDAAQGLSPQRELASGYVWVSVQDQVMVGDETYYQINAGEYVRAEALSFYQPSRFQGVALTRQPERPFAWILRAVQPLLTPGGAVNPKAPWYGRYELVQIFATENLGDEVWYLIGPHQWINQIYVGKVTPTPRPADVPPDAAWIDVDLFEQTLAAYVGDQMIYATLVSSGLPGWDTPPGLFQVWLKVKAGKMSGAYNRPDYYFLEDVPWTMYFNRDVALHTAYWHDGFGYRHSHGCVNLAPADARWLFEWAPDDAWVWVH